MSKIAQKRGKINFLFIENMHLYKSKGVKNSLHSIKKALLYIMIVFLIINPSKLQFWWKLVRGWVDICQTRVKKGNAGKTLVLHNFSFMHPFSIIFEVPESPNWALQVSHMLLHISSKNDFWGCQKLHKNAGKLISCL